MILRKSQPRAASEAAPSEVSLVCTKCESGLVGGRRRYTYSFEGTHGSGLTSRFAVISLMFPEAHPEFVVGEAYTLWLDS